MLQQQRVDLRTRALAGSANTRPNASNTATGADPRKSGGGGAGAHRTARIVVIDPDPMALMRVENLLRSKEYEVITYASVAAAMAGLEILVHAVLLSIAYKQNVEQVRSRCWLLCVF